MVPVLTCGSETMIWRQKEESSIWAVQMNNLRGFVGFMRMYKVSNARIKQLCGMTKNVNEKIDENVLRWFGHA